MSLLRASFRHAAIFRTGRNFSRTTLLHEEAKLAKTVENTSTNSFDALKLGRVHAPSRMEKTFLVWSGRYKSVAEVPATVSAEAIEKARNKARIRVANYMILATIVGCIGCIISGKRAASRGESVQKSNMASHSQYYAKVQEAENNQIKK